MNFDNVIIYDPGSGRYAQVDAEGKLLTSTQIGFSGDIQLGAVEIKDGDTNNRVKLSQIPSGDYAMLVIPASMSPLHSSQVNPNYTFTRNASQAVTKVEQTIEGTVYTKDITRDASGDVVEIGAWY